jgi:hypothetical protein
MFRVVPTRVAAPPVPVVVRVMVPCLPLNVFQSVEVRYPLADVVAAGILITGVVPPVDDTGAVAVTDVTPEDAVVETLTKSDPFHAATHFSPATIVMPDVGPTPRSTIDCVLLALMTTYALL